MQNMHLHCIHTYRIIYLKGPKVKQNRADMIAPTRDAVLSQSTHIDLATYPFPDEKMTKDGATLRRAES
jgi:hypothetical protein